MYFILTLSTILGVEI